MKKLLLTLYVIKNKNFIPYTISITYIKIKLVSPSFFFFFFFNCKILEKSIAAGLLSLEPLVGQPHNILVDKAA